MTHDSVTSTPQHKHQRSSLERLHKLSFGGGYGDFCIIPDQTPDDWSDPPCPTTGIRWAMAIIFIAMLLL
ncbi:hypothetical protein STEG23_032906 [Scotinomys teguina]